MTREVEILRADAPPPATVTDPATLMNAITRAASDPNVNVDKLERLMTMYERISANDARVRAARAKALMQPELEGVVKRGQNSSTKSRYVKWDDILLSIRPTLGEYGFELSFRTGPVVNGMLPLTGILTHEAGHSEETTLPLPIDSSGSKNPVQGVGSTVTYGKRYVAGLLLNIAALDEADDDAQAASRNSRRDDAEPVTVEQAAEIRKQLDEVGGDTRRFCQYLGVNAIAQIPASDYDRALTFIDKKRKAKTARNAQ
jgi:hypothetical protein